MCLNIHNMHHINSYLSSHPTGLVSIAPILVWKVLWKANFISGLAPYRETMWIFNKCATVPRLRISRDHDVTEGLHAFISPFTAKHEAKSWYGNAHTVHPAIIPVGSNLLFGKDHDVVSTSLIVFKNIAAVRAKYGSITEAMKYTELTKAA